MRRLIFLMLPVLLALNAAPACSQSLEELERQLSDIVRVRCGFDMERRLEGVERPLQSSGTVLLDRAFGVALLQRAPFAMEMIAGHDVLKERVGQGGSRVFKRQDAPAVFAVADEVVRNVFGFSRAALERSFEVSYEDRGERGYRLALKPRDDGVMRLVSSLEISSSDAFPETLFYVSAQGDETRMRFADVVLNGAELSDDERSLFK